MLSLKVEEQKALEQLQRTQEQDDNYTEMANNIHGDMLTENPSCATSAFGNHRYSDNCTHTHVRARMHTNTHTKITHHHIQGDTRQVEGNESSTD